MNDEILELTTRRNDHALKQSDLQRDLDGIAQATSHVRNLSIEFEHRQDIGSGVGKTAAVLALVAGIAALGPGAPAVFGDAGTLGSVTGFLSWWHGAAADDRRQALALGLQGCARLRGSVLHQMETAAAHEAAAAAELEAADEHKARLRRQQAEIGSSTGRGVLWPKR